MSQLPILYDADCGFCHWALSKVLLWDRAERLRPIALQDREVDALLGRMPEERRMASWHLVLEDGSVHSGGYAFAPLLRLLPGGKPLSVLTGVLPGPSDRAYRLVAEHRIQISRWVPTRSKVRARPRGRAVASRRRRDSGVVSRPARRGALVEGEGAALAFSLGLTAAVLWPLRENWRKSPRDSFPLSYYPMFAARRRKRLKVTHLVGHDAQGGRHTLSYRYVADGGLNQVRKQISRAVKAGQADALCAVVATRVVERPRSTHPPLASVSVVTCEYALAEWYAGARAPLREDVHASRPVVGTTSATVPPGAA